jgi:hypothetical protein
VYRQGGRPARTSYDAHGLTGFAWAARRDVLTRNGLYDSCIAGGADHFMAHAFTGEFDSRCHEVLFGGRRSRHREHAAEWARGVYADVRGEVDSVPGVALHLWHGAPTHRQFTSRYVMLAENAFDPGADVRVSPEGCWEWASDKPLLHQQMRAYFLARAEDGDELHPPLARTPP